MNGEEHKRKIAEIFMESFKNKDFPIALYGTGINTEEICRMADGYSIVGLIDPQKEGQTMYGCSVLTADEAVERGAKAIVIVAREEVVPIIYQRIAYLEEQGIRICNIRNESVSGLDKDTSYRNNPYWNKTEESLIKEIDAHDIITFDVFDTVIVRNVQRPEDIFRIIEKKLKNTKYRCSFFEMRKNSEKAASRNNPFATYEQIYSTMKELYNLSDEAVKFLSETELNVEKQFIDVRKVVAEMISYAKSVGKKVFLLSDMYFGKKEISFLLDKFDISGFDDIFTSSDLKKSKWPDGAAYKWLKEQFGEDKSYLHIGDNLGVDIEKARESGIDAFYVMSVYDMMVHSSANKLLVNVYTLSDSIVIGMLCNKLFNDPFALSETKGDMFIEDYYGYGYLTFGALVTGTINWLVNELKDKENTHIWFLARDGYIFEKVYRLYKEYVNRNIPKADYVLSSRRSCKVAELYNWYDIKYNIKYANNRSNSLVLEKVFGLNLNKYDNADIENKNLEECIFEFKDEILENAEKERTQYLKYLQNYYNNDENIVLFDLVTTGTSYYATSKLLDGHNVSLYCLAGVIVPDYSTIDETNSKAYMGYSLRYSMEFNVDKYCDELEPIFKSSNPTLLYIDENGEPVFWDIEKRTVNMEELQMAHTGILDFAKELYSFIDYEDIDNITARLADDICGLFHNDECIDKNGVIKREYPEDYFQIKYCAVCMKRTF